MYTDEEINLIILSSFNFSYRVNRLLLSDFKHSTPDFENNENYLIKTLSDGVYNKVKALFYDGVYRESVLDGLQKRGIKCVTYFSADYPEALKNIDEPPCLLYCKGDTSLLNTQCFSVVGSRKTLAKQLKACASISGELSEKFTIVSGIAEGADENAVKGALDNGGRVISVLANGLDYIYPASNAKLLKRVEESGLVISEHPPEVKPQRYYFPFRNRIIAGLSRGTLVVSAGEKSGALKTAAYAFEYNRSVFAFPYCQGITSGEGCNELIKKGASLTTNVLDIFKDFGLDFKVREEEPMSDDERAVYEFIKQSGKAFLPAICDKLEKPLSYVIGVITSLMIKGLIVSEGGNRYSAQ